MSATEELAARYRHLFVLPGTAALTVSAGLASLLLSLAAHSGTWIISFAVTYTVTFLCALVVSNVLRLEDMSTIATFRRTIAVLMAGELLWLILVAGGDLYSFAAGSSQSLANAVLFGAFICGGFEFLVIVGTFSRSIPVSAVLAAVHPLGTFLVIGRPAGTLPLTPIGAGTGFVALAVIAAFPLILRRRKTSRGHDAIRLFQAFMKTWTSHTSADLERIIQDHAESAEITTKVMKFHRTDGDIFVVLPGVHPGPFFPVGSYNLPGLISHELNGLGPTMTLHRPGGHERNLASNEQARTYAASLREFATELDSKETGTMRGPVQARIGKATVNSIALSNDIVLTISFAPLGSDDLDPRVEDELSDLAAKVGLRAFVVDAHNSISREQEYPDTRDSGWMHLFNAVKETNSEPLKVAYAHSNEVGFSRGEDITENGIGLLMLETSRQKSVLILADANNAVPELHEDSARTLESSGYTLIEFCTSDSHDLAAKGLTVTRGYKALGEDTPLESIRRLIVSLAKLAESRLSQCRYGSGELKSTVRLFGSKALDEFASITQASSEFARKYLKFGALSVLALFAVSLVG